MSNSIYNISAAFDRSPGTIETKSVSELAMDQTVHKLETFRASYFLTVTLASGSGRKQLRIGPSKRRSNRYSFLE
jgi:hypothetical protein